MRKRKRVDKKIRLKNCAGNTKNGENYLAQRVTARNRKF